MRESELPNQASIRDPRELTDDEWFEQAKRIAAPPTDDDLCVIAGMGRPATPEELIALIEQDLRERGLTPP